MIIVLLLALVTLAAWLSRRARGAVVPAAEIGTLGWVAGTRWAVARPLARAESRRLLRHPAFLVGVALTPLMLAGATGSETSWWRLSPSAALALVPLGWATIVAADLLALQPRRTGADELLAAAPAPQPVRSIGLMLAALPAVIVAAVIAGGWLVYMARSSLPLTGTPRPVEVAAGLAIVAGSVVVGVGVARWLPHVGFGIVAAVATAVIQARFFELSAWPWHRTEADPLRFLAFLADSTSVDLPALEVRPAGWHLVYLAGLVLLMAGVALARDGVPRPLGAFLGAALALTAVAGWAQVRPPTHRQVAAMVDVLTRPEANQTCTVGGPVRYCAWEEHLGRVTDWRRRVDAVRALVPAAVAARPLVVADRVPTVIGNSNCSPQPFLDGLHPDVVGRVSVAAIWPEDGAVHPGTDRFPCGGHRANELFTAVQAGSWAVGLPSTPHHLDVRCTATGQARSAVALWLGAAATPEGRLALRGLLDEPTSVPGMITFADWDDPPMWGVVFSTADAELALRLSTRPSEQVAERLGRAWDTVVAPGTTSAELAELAGVAGPPAVAPGTTSAELAGVAGPPGVPGGRAAGPACP